jgi:hypothetical protein
MTFSQRPTLKDIFDGRRFHDFLDSLSMEWMTLTASAPSHMLAII